MIAFAKPDNILAMPTKSNEWFTPARYVEAARQVMGSIDLDPASCELANRTVKATRYYTERDNGLSKPWQDRIWLNPPYYAPDRRNPMGPWSRKLIHEYEQGNVQQAIMLIMGGTYNRWFQPLWQYSICFTDHKIQFARPGNRRTEELYLRDITVFIYLGPNNEKFAEVFSEFGPVIPANVAVRRQQITPLSLWEVSK